MWGRREKFPTLPLVFQPLYTTRKEYASSVLSLNKLPFGFWCNWKPHWQLQLCSYRSPSSRAAPARQTNKTWPCLDHLPNKLAHAVTLLPCTREVPISAGITTTLTVGVHGFLQANDSAAHQIGPPPWSFPIHYSLTIPQFEATLYTSILC